MDYTGNISAILFTGGCNMRCFYCHNPQFVEPSEVRYLSTSTILKFLESRKNKLNGIVVCGGEPTIHTSLPDWLYHIKSGGYLVKLDTNGSRPKMIETLIKNDLVDFISVDYKSPKKSYREMSSSAVDPLNMSHSIELIVKSGIKYEVRSTIHPDFHTKKMVFQMMKEVKECGSQSYVLQAYVHRNKTVGALQPPKLSHDLNAYLPELASLFKQFGIRI